MISHASVEESMNSARIAMVTPYWFPVRGGITTYVAELAAELRRSSSAEVHVLARDGGAPGAKTLGGTAPEFAKRATTELASIRPDVVHAHAHWYTLVAALRHRRRHPGTRVVFTLHTPFPRRATWKRYGLKLLMSQADFLTGVSADLLSRTIRAHRPRVRTRVTYGGVSVRPTPEGGAETFRREYGLGRRRPLIGYLGPLAWEGKVRGVEQLIRAMRLVRQAVPTATLMIGGDGPHRERLETLAAAETPDGVVFLGDVPDPTPRFFTAVEVYAHISYQEGLPLSLLEAMACNSAIVASAVGGIPEVIQDGHNGFLVSNEPPEVASRIIEILQSPELHERLVRRAKDDVSLRFAWPRAAGRFLPLFGAPTPHRVVVTVDLERDYHASGASFRGVEEALPTLLDLFDRHRIRTTMFATADLSTKHSDSLREIHRRGHELGCHGESHDVEFLSSKPYEWQRDSIRRATEALERSTRVRLRGFRAPNFSANGDTIRALEELGYLYDSSVLPGRIVKANRIFERLDFLVAPRDPYRPSRHDPALPGDSKVWEFPVAENPLAPGGPIGLGYLNAFGVDQTLDAVARCAGDPCVFLVHPWELVDPPPGKVPSWMRRACTHDASKLDKFLGFLRVKHEVTTFDKESSISISG